MVGERCECVDKCVDQIAIALPPPHHHGVDDVVVVLIDQVLACAFSDEEAKVGIAVLVPPDLLHDGARADAQLLRQSVLTCRAVGGGAAHEGTLL